MTVQDKATLKSYFNGSPVPSVPTPGNYEDLIDSMELYTGKDYSHAGFGYMRIAQGQANCAHNIGIFRVVSVKSGAHTSIIFSATITYGQQVYMNLISHSKYAAGNLTHLRICYNSTYDQPFLEVNTTAPGDLHVMLVGGYGWELIDGPATGSIPSGYTTLVRDISSMYYPEASIAPWSGITGKPSTFTPSAHTHVGSDVISGYVPLATWALTAGDADFATDAYNSAQLGGWAASMYHINNSAIVNSHDAMIGGGISVGTTSDIAGTGQVVATGDIFPLQNEAGLGYRHASFLSTSGPNEDFDGSSRPGTWSFSTTGSNSDQYNIPSHVNITGGSGLALLYESLGSNRNWYAKVDMTTNTAGNIGIRLQNGSDTSYYVEWIVQLDTTNKAYDLILQYRLGSGDTNHVASTAPVQITGAAMPVILWLNTGGTAWTNWNAQGLIKRIGSPGATYITGAVISGLTWTPSRVGIKVYNPGGTWEDFYCDYWHRSG